MMCRSSSPNFLVIVTDQHRADHLGCYGNAQIQTPAIDSIARSGTIFKNFFVNSPNCTANRASLMTCRPSFLHNASLGKPLSLDQVTFVEELRQMGYKTKLIGKAHLQSQTDKPSPLNCAQNDANPLFPGRYNQEKQSLWKDGKNQIDLPYYGFSDVDIVIGHGDIAEGHYGEWLRKTNSSALELRGPGNAKVLSTQIPHAYKTSLPVEQHPTCYISQRAAEFLRDSSNENPFFLMVSFPDPHHVS